MLTDLSFLEIGASFPPKCQEERIKMYHHNKELFEGEHYEVYEKEFKRIQRVIGNFDEVISYPIVLNFQKLLSLKIADLLLGEPPAITAGDAESPEQISVNTIMNNSDLINTSYQTAIDVSRYGDGLFYVRDENGQGVIDITQPPLWFPVVANDNIKKISYHVLAWAVKDKDSNIENTGKLYVQIHSKGYRQDKVFNLNGGEIVSLISDSGELETGLDDFAIVQVSNVMTSDRVTGIDDYTDLDSIVAELSVRCAQVARILDKHAAPAMSGPSSALERDPLTGQFRLKTNSYFVRDSSDDPTVEYITWEGQLSANFVMIEKLTNLLYTISEMGSALFGDMSQSAGQIPSGSALKRLLISPLAKVNRIRMRFDEGLKNAICLCSQLGGKDVIPLTVGQINITWNDGLPADEKEQAELMKMRTGDKATISQLSAIKRLDNLKEEGADEELARILDDEASLSPVIAQPFADQTPSENPEDKKDENKDEDSGEV